MMNTVMKGVNAAVPLTPGKDTLAIRTPDSSTFTRLAQHTALSVHSSHSHSHASLDPSSMRVMPSSTIFPAA